MAQAQRMSSRLLLLRSLQACTAACLVAASHCLLRHCPFLVLSWGVMHNDRQICWEPVSQGAGESSEVYGAEAAEEKAAQEFKQRTEAGAGASDTKPVVEQVHFLTLDGKNAPPSLLPLEQYIPDRAVILTQWPGSVQKRSWSGFDSKRPIVSSVGIAWLTNLVKVQLSLPHLAHPSLPAISGEACAGGGRRAGRHARGGC